MNKIYTVSEKALGHKKGLTRIDLWERIFPRLPDFFSSYLNYSVLDEIGDGETAAVRGCDYETIREIQAELMEMAFAIAHGMLNIEDFLDDLAIDLVPEYLELPPLEWLADVQYLLQKSVHERYGE